MTRCHNMPHVQTGECALRIKVGFADLTEEQLQAAHSEAAKQGITLRESLLRLGIVNEAALLRTAAADAGWDFLDTIGSDIDPKVRQTVTANIASHYTIMPLEVTDDVLTVATCDPFTPGLKREIELVLGGARNVQFVLATGESIRKAIRTSYGLGAATVEQMISSREPAPNPTEDLELTDENKAREASVMKLVSQLLADAIGSGATDIHIEPYVDSLRIRYRIDGMLHDAGIPTTARHFREGITSRIKIMSGLDIAEKRLPQDGRAQVEISGHKFDLRVSVLPTRYGEAINIRILSEGTLISDFAALGMPEREARALRRLIVKPHGIILVTGPTGSGKTTTLYTCMSIIKETDCKIITIEDPIEYDMPGIVQMQVHPEIGFTFARALRSMLRHDPDVMLVGEIRDLETAQIAIRTALTGHLVFSTLHTNDAAGSIARLLDMGVEPYLLASSIEAVLGQRLIRLICPACKEHWEPDPEVATAVKAMAQIEMLPPLSHGRGCAACRFTGYQGRTVITELLLMSDPIRAMTITHRHSNEIDAQGRREGMTSLFQSGFEKVRQGLTTAEEILRVTNAPCVTE